MEQITILPIKKDVMVPIAQLGLAEKDTEGMKKEVKMKEKRKKCPLFLSHESQIGWLQKPNYKGKAIIKYLENSKKK